MDTHDRETWRLLGFAHDDLESRDKAFELILGHLVYVVGEVGGAKADSLGPGAMQAPVRRASRCERRVVADW
jgi:hypothetical protein